MDELFRYKVSHKTSLKGVFADVFPNAEYLGDGTRDDERDESGADRRYVFKSPHGKQFYVYERDNSEIFVNIADFSTGERGQAVYAAVANYAYNTNKKFIGDPAGLTGDSLIRRTSNMLSSTLRFGTTKHLEAADQQIAGDPKNGVEPLDWRAHLELVRLQCVAEYSSSPLYQAAAARDPEYWNKFSTGQVHLYGEAI